MEGPINSETVTQVQSTDPSSDLKNITNTSSNQTDGKAISSSETGEVGQKDSTEDATQNQNQGPGEGNQYTFDPNQDSDEDDPHYMDQPGLDYLDEYKDCTCCKGHIYNCDGEICQEIGECYCYGLDPQ